MERNGSDPGRLRVKRKTLEALLAECQRAIQLGTLELEGGGDDSADDSEADDGAGSPSSGTFRDDETTERQLCDLIKSRVECPDFLVKLESAQASASLYMAEESASWDMVNENDVWEGGKELDQEDYVLVRQEDILDGVACFMATYLLSLKETKELTPNQLQDVLCKAFSVKKKKGKLRKAWDGSKVMYNVASWGATAIGLPRWHSGLRATSYQNSSEQGVGLLGCGNADTSLERHLQIL